MGLKNERNYTRENISLHLFLKIITHLSIKTFCFLIMMHRQSFKVLLPIAIVILLGHMIFENSTVFLIINGEKLHQGLSSLLRTKDLGTYT